MPRTTHGMSKSPEYRTWIAMKKRCYYSKTNDYARYGGSGVTVCDEWRHDFAAFYAHIGPRPSRQHSIDRIDGTRGYEPNNVRWADAKQQAANRRHRDRLVARTCMRCGRGFVTYEYVVRRGEGRYCSHRCGVLARATSVSRFCTLCGAEVRRKPSELAKRARVFCSTKCCSLWRWEHGGYGPQAKDNLLPLQPNQA